MGSAYFLMNYASSRVKGTNELHDHAARQTIVTGKPVEITAVTRSPIPEIDG
jgi:hypothetical protein